MDVTAVGVNTHAATVAVGDHDKDNTTTGQQGDPAELRNMVQFGDVGIHEGAGPCNHNPRKSMDATTMEGDHAKDHAKTGQQGERVLV